MKHFIYMNNGLINSYLAQINNGLENKKQQEISSGTSQTETELSKPTKVKSEVALKSPKIDIGGFINIGDVLSGKLSIENKHLELINALTSTETGKELVEKVMHDNAFEYLYSYLVKNDKLIESNDILNEGNIGSYVLLRKDFEIYNIDEICKRMGADTIDYITFGLIKVQIQSMQSEIENIDDKNAKSIAKSKFNLLKKELEKDAQNQKNDIQFGVDTLRNISNFLPSSEFIICEDCFIPLNKIHLREDSYNIRFGYSGKISILGRYTKTMNTNDISNNDDDNLVINVIHKLFDTAIIDLYKSSLFNKDEIKIINPIAVYFE